jgi:CheY-like chemotaxis protein
MARTLLVLDRNATVQRVMKLAFKDESVQVNAVRTDREAFAAIDAQPPDIIFTEDARKVVAFLKSRPKLPHIPVVLLKGAFDSPNAGAEEQLADDVLMKPLQPDAMIDCVKRLLHTKNSVPPAPPSLPSAADLDLEQYFDQLEAAFNEADTTPSKLEGEPWEGAFPPAVDVGQKRLEIAHLANDRTASESAGLGHPAPAEQQVTNELVDQVAQRVMDRLGDRLVRSTTTEVVSRLSKWLLVNELEKGRSTQ